MENELKITKIADSVHGTIEISSLEKKIVSTQVFNRLHNILQNSTVYLTYPSNKTRRFEHSLGALYLGGQMFFNSIVNADEEVRDEFLECCKKEIGQIIEEKSFKELVRKDLDKHASIVEEYENIRIKDPLLIKNTPDVIKEEYNFVYSVVFQALRIAALVHDIGHPPFSHVSEYALNDLKNYLEGLGEKINEQQKEFLKIIKMDEKEEEKEDDKKLHEKAGLQISERLVTKIEDIGDIDNEDKAELQLFYCLVRRVSIKILNNEAPVFESIHSLVDGPMDCDRLDYISRDMENSGFNFGRIEYDRFVNSMKLLRVEDMYYFCPDIRVLSTIEDLFQRRWSLHKYVIFHHRVIKTDHLLQNVVFELSKLYLEGGESKSEKKEGTNFIPLNISGLWKGIKETYSDLKYFDTINQWDDSWLITVLRQEYFSNYYGEDDLIGYQLEELLSNKKNYISAIKRLDDFKILDKSVKNHFDKSIIEKVKKIIDRTEELLKRGFFLKGLEEALKYIKNSEICVLEDDFEKLITEVVKTISLEEYNCIDCIVKFKKPNTGLDNPTFVFDYKRNNVVNLEDVSRIHEDLINNQSFFPMFFIYVIPSGKTEFNKDKFLEDIGKAIANKLNQNIS